MIEKDEIEARRAAARAKRAELERAAEERAAAAAILAEVEAEEHAVKNAEALAAAEAAHGPVGRAVRLIETPIGGVVVKRPHAAIFRRFQDAGSFKSAELEKLVRPCVVYPDATALDRILEELPGTLVRLANVVSELAGVRAEEQSGKS